MLMIRLKAQIYLWLTESITDLHTQQIWRQMVRLTRRQKLSPGTLMDWSCTMMLVELLKYNGLTSVLPSAGEEMFVFTGFNEISGHISSATLNLIYPPFGIDFVGVFGTKSDTDYGDYILGQRAETTNQGAISNQSPRSFSGRKQRLWDNPYQKRFWLVVDAVWNVITQDRNLCSTINMAADECCYSGNGK